MGMLDHWHPIYPSHNLRRKPVEVKLAGQPICLFRTTNGTIAAVDNACPHRRMKLSYGTVVGDRIQCKYHGWTYDSCGNGESPGTPKMTTCTKSYDVREEHDFIWLKSRDSNPVFPLINIKKYYPIGTFQHTVPAPLELTVDNFTEIEHSGTVHDTFGYDLDRMHEVKVRFDQTEDTISVANVGPTKRIFRPFAWMLGIRHDDLFHDDWTTHFSPVYSVYDHYWTTPDGSKDRLVRWRLYMFFWPIDAENTCVTSFVYAKSKYPGPSGGLHLFKHLFRREVDREVRQDISMLENLADRNISIEGLKLSRFDKVLGLTRERIDRIYRGKTPPLIVLPRAV